MLTLLRKLSLWAAVLGIAAVVIMVRRTTSVGAVPEPPSPPAKKPSARGIAAAGMVEALRENTGVGVPVGGLLVKVGVKVWDRVKAGDPLFIIDQRELQAQMMKDRAQLEIEEAELQRAKHQRARTAALVASQGVSQEEAQNRDDECALREARTRAAYAAAKATEALLARLTVRAPIDGTILQVNVREGEYLAPGSATPPILLGAIDEVQVRADVDEQIAPRVKADGKATGYLKGDTQHPIPLEFVRIEPFVTPKRNLTGSSSERVDTRVLQVIYKFPNPASRRIYVGQQMDLFIEE